MNMNSQQLRAYAKKMDLDYCQHGMCHYFALALAAKYDLPVCIWREFNTEMGREVLVHAFCKLTNNVYIDAEGVFADISERQNDFEHWKTPVFSTVTSEGAKTFFRRIGLPYGETETKRIIKAWLELHPLVMTLRTPEGGQRQYVYCQPLTTRVGGTKMHYVFDVLPNGDRAQRVHKLSDNELQIGNVLNMQFRRLGI